VAARAAVLPGSPLSALAAELARSRRTLDGFASDDVTVDVHAVFSWSYWELGAATARMFRLLSLHPGPDVTVPAWASLAGVCTRTRPARPSRSSAR